MARATQGAVAMALLLLPAMATAQVGLSLPPVQDEAVRGLRFGQFVWVPFLGIEGRYHSNVFRQDSREGRSEAGILTIRPGFSLKNPDFSWLHLTWDASVDVNFWFSDDPNVRKQGRVAAETGLRAEFFPKSTVGFYVADRFVRTSTPPNESSVQRYDRNFNHVGAGIQVRPGSALDFSLGYAYAFDRFDRFAEGNRSFHEVRLLGLWKFFPKTLFLGDVDWRYQQWSQARTGFRADSMPLRAAVGVRGFVTRQLALEVRAGYGQGFYREGTDVRTFIGKAALAWMPTPFTLVDFGYQRDFEDAAFYGRWFTSDSLRLKVAQQFLRRITLAGEFGWSYLSYPRLVPGAADLPGYSAVAVSQDQRRDHALKARLEVGYSALRYLSLKVGYQMDGIRTGFRMTGTTPGGTPLVDYGGWWAHQVFGEIQVLY